MKKVRIFCLVMAFVAVLTAVARKSDSESYNMKRAVEEMNNGNIDYAIEFCNKEVADNPENGEAHLAIALYSVVEEDYKKGLSELDKAIKYIPSKQKNYRAIAYMVRGRIFLNLADTVKALNDFNTAVKTDSDYDDAYYSRANLYMTMGRLDESDSDLRKAMTINAADLRSYLGLGKNELLRGNYESAIEHFDKAVSINKENSDAFTGRAMAKVALQNYVEAADDALEAMAIDYDDNAIEILEDFPEQQLPMLIAKLKSRSLKDSCESIWPYEIAQIYKKRKIYDKAIDAFKDVLAIDEHPLIYMELADCLEQLGDFEEALALIRKAWELDTEHDDYILSRIALITEYLGALDEALEIWDDVIAREPDNFYPYYRKGFIKEKQREYDDALVDIEMALLFNPEYAHPLLVKADILSLRGETEKAKDCYSQILEIDNDPTSESVAMYAYCALGDFDKAREFMQKIIDIDPDDAGVYYDAACLYSRLGERETALEYLRTALEKGFRKYRLILSDNDFDELRETDGFRQLYDEYKDGFEKVPHQRIAPFIPVSSVII